VLNFKAGHFVWKGRVQFLFYLERHVGLHHSSTTGNETTVVAMRGE